MRRTERKINIPDLVRAMTEAGASFYFTPAGTLFVRDLASLPCYLRDAFFDADEKGLVTYIKQQMAEADNKAA